jgi:hypothetical protein
MTKLTDAREAVENVHVEGPGAIPAALSALLAAIEEGNAPARKPAAKAKK